VVPGPLPVAQLAVRRWYLIVAPGPLPAAPRRCRSRSRTTRQMYSGTE
jgi:hypothetical protein